MSNQSPYFSLTDASRTVNATKPIRTLSQRLTAARERDQKETSAQDREEECMVIDDWTTEIQFTKRVVDMACKIVTSYEPRIEPESAKELFRLLLLFSPQRQQLQQEINEVFHFDLDD